MAYSIKQTYPAHKVHPTIYQEVSNYMSNNTMDSKVTVNKISTRQLALIGLMSAVICILGPLSIVTPFSPIPISLCTLAICFVVTVLGMKWGTLSVLIYILLGLVGLPVLSGFTGGVGKLLGPTGGYIIGYIFMALIYGFFADRFSGRIVPLIIGLLLGNAACYLFGTIWYAYQASLPFSAAFAGAVLPFIPGDLVKMVVALTVGFQVRKRLHRAGLL